MTSELSIFAAQMREFISFQAEEFDSETPSSDGGLAQHADAQFNGYAMLLFALQFKANAPYRKFCEARGVKPDRLTHWTEIPAAPTTAFKEFEFTCLPPEQRTVVFHSSGTTGQQPSRHFHSAESLSLYEESLWPWFRQNLRFTIYDLRLVILTPPPAQAPHSSLVHMFDTVRRKFGAQEDSFVGRADKDGSWLMDLDKAGWALNVAFREKKPLMLLGTAFSLVQLLDMLEESKLDYKLPPGSRLMETGGYKGRSRVLPRNELHALISERLAVPASHIICEYGMSELSSQAYDRTVADSAESSHFSLLTRHFDFPPWARAQVVSPETGREVADGETGLIRVFDLANVFSAMAVQTEDLAIRRGNGFELLGRAEQTEPRGCSLMTP